MKTLIIYLTNYLQCIFYQMQYLYLEIILSNSELTDHHHST